MSSSDTCHIFSLPNELILCILSSLHTTELLPLTVVSHRFSSLIIRILHTRLQYASLLHGNTLLLECYHPSAKLTEDPLYCQALGTPGLEQSINHRETAYNVEKNPAVHLMKHYARLGSLYSRFRPYRKERDISRLNRRHPAGDIPGSRTHPSSASPSQNQGGGHEELVRQSVTLESHELFTQLCAVLNLVKVGPRNGLFRRFIELEEGVVRVWRDWLSMMCQSTEPCQGDEDATIYDMEKRKEDTVVEDVQNDRRVLWVSRARNVGVRFRVKKRMIRRDSPLLIDASEEIAVSYEIEYEGELPETLPPAGT